MHLSHPSPCHTREWLSLFDSTYSTLYFPAFLLSVFLFPFFHLSDEQQPELNKKDMENLRHSAANEGEDTYDVFIPTKRAAQIVEGAHTKEKEDVACPRCDRELYALNTISGPILRCQIQVWSDDRWLACLAAGGGSKRRYQYCSDNSGTILYLRALQGHSGNNLIDPTLQDNVVIGTGIFRYIYHVGCTFNLHSIKNNGLIPGGQNLSRRQTVFFSPVHPRDESHRDPERIDFSVPRLARYMHSAWKRHQDAVFWVDIDLAITEGLTFYQTRSNAIILQGTLPAHYLSKVERLKTGEILYERRYLSPRPPPKISLKHDHDWTRGNDQVGSTVEQQPVGKARSTVFWRSTSC